MSSLIIINWELFSLVFCFEGENSQPELKTCGNGLAFDAADPKFLKEDCDYLHNVDCGDRSELEPPIGSANCPRLYGKFPFIVHSWRCKS